MQQLLDQLRIGPYGMAAAAAAVAFLAVLIVYGIAAHSVSKSKSKLDDLVVRHSRGPILVIVPALAAKILYPQMHPVLLHLLSLVVIAGAAWLFMRATLVVEDFILDKHPLDTADNLRSRKLHTQVKVIRRIVVAVIGVVGTSAMLMTFPSVKQLGASILASAGIIGVVVGMAARPALANWIAGVQLAITQPIRLDDVVIVEGEWGRIEEITTTYVVVCIWDLRRLIVPLSYFLEHPIQNWTHSKADIMGTVYLHMDYTVPLDALRKELERIVNEEGKELWDGKVCGISVVDATDKTMTVRPLVSSADAGKNWDLRCLVREKLIAFIQKKYPDALPKIRRVEMKEPAKA